MPWTKWTCFYNFAEIAQTSRSYLAFPRHPQILSEHVQCISTQGWVVRPHPDRRKQGIPGSPPLYGDDKRVPEPQTVEQRREWASRTPHGGQGCHRLRHGSFDLIRVHRWPARRYAECQRHSCGSDHSRDEICHRHMRQVSGRTRKQSVTFPGGCFARLSRTMHCTLSCKITII